MILRHFQRERPKTGTYTVISLTDYSNGHSECTATTVKDPISFKKKSKEQREKDLQKLHDDLLDSQGVGGDEGHLIFMEATQPKKPITDFDRLENKHRALRRTKSVIRKKIIEGELDHFLTLTYKENKLDLKEAWKDWKKFIRLVLKKYPTLKYLVICERQKRGAIHFHAAVHGFMHANSIRALWLKIVGEGNIDIKRKKRDQSLHGLAKYITKYITKQFDELEDFKNLYRCSKNIKLRITKFYLTKEYALIGDSIIDEFINTYVPNVLQDWSDSNGLYSTRWVSSLAP